MSMSKSKFWYSNNCLHFSMHSVSYLSTSFMSVEAVFKLWFLWTVLGDHTGSIGCYSRTCKRTFKNASDLKTWGILDKNNVSFLKLCNESFFPGWVFTKRLKIKITIGTLWKQKKTLVQAHSG